MRKRSSIVVVLVLFLLVSLKVYTHAEEINAKNGGIKSINTEPVVEEWAKNFGGSGYDSFGSVIETEDGYIVGGYSSSTDIDGLDINGHDAIIVKYDINGKILWKKNFGGSNEDDFHSIIKDSDSYIVVGLSQSKDIQGIENKGVYDSIIVKYDKEGNIVWQKNWGGSGYDSFGSVIETEDGYIVVGSSVSTDIDGLINKGSSDAIIIKYDKEGNIVWQKNWGGSGYDSFGSVIETEDGYIVGGYSSSTDIEGLPDNGAGVGIIVKYDKEGNVVWQNKDYDGSYFESLTSVTVIEDGYIAVSNDGAILKYDKEGNLVWRKKYEIPGGLSSVQALDDGFIVAGYITSLGNVIVNKGGYDAIIIKYDKEGNVVWQKNWGGGYDDWFYSIKVTGNSFIAVGKSSSTYMKDITNKGEEDAIIVKYSMKDITKFGEKETYECINEINYKKNKKYNSYKIGDKVEYNGDNYYVIENSDDNAMYLTLLKENPLTVEEINANGINSEGVNILNQGSDSSKGTAYNLLNNIGGMNYYSSDSCNSTSQVNCSSYYNDSNIKVVVDNWANSAFNNNDLIEVDGYKARLITADELVFNLGYDVSGSTTFFLFTLSDDVPEFMYNSNYAYWTMTRYEDSNDGVYIINNDGDSIASFGTDQVSPHIGVFDNYAVRPVVNVNKCAITDGCYEEKEEIGKCEDIDSNVKSENHVVDVGNTLNVVSNVILIICGMLILGGIFFLVYSYNKSKKEIRKHK